MQAFAPMLAVAADEPFDSSDYVFEVKWDGIRTLTWRDASGWRLWGREGADYTSRYPELAVLAALPVGTALDGEMVLCTQGVPDLPALLARHAHARGSRFLAQPPVRYHVFDALYEGGRCLFGRPLLERRALAQQHVAALADERVAFSEGVIGSGRALFQQAVAAGHEGVMAKHRASPYRPGCRCSFWKKIKPWRRLPAVILGYVPGRYGVRRLLVAAVHQDQFRFVAELRSGLTAALRRQLATCLAGRTCLGPVVPCRRQAVWVRPQLYCQVRYLGWTAHGTLRCASFAGLLTAADGVALPAVPETSA